MAKRLVRGIIGVIVGFVAGMVFMMALHMASTVVYPPPENVDLMSQDPENVERMNAWFESLPTGAFLLAVASHGLGCMFGAIVAMLISGRHALWPSIVIGVLFTICGVANLFSIPHPSWFPYVDIPIYLILAVIAGNALKRRAPAPKP